MGSQLARISASVLPASISKMAKGVEINIDGKIYKTKPCTASLFLTEPSVPTRNPPIRFRKEIPTTWLKLILKEGKNRQARKMCAAVGFPVLRLIRYRIEQISIEGLQPGEMQEMSKGEIYKLLEISS